MEGTRSHGKYATSDSVSITIPGFLGVSPDDVVEVIQAAVPEKFDEFRASIATVDETTGRDLGPAEVDFLISLGGGAAAWFTTKWADTYLWPVLQKKFGKAAKSIMDVIKSQAGDE